ncbi:hypothetical protein Tco_0581892 [Tanacetum coccineum]
MLDSRGPILRMKTIRALVAIQEMSYYSQKWHDGESSRDLGESSSDRMSVITNKLNDLGKDCHLKEEVNSIKATGYGEGKNYVETTKYPIGPLGGYSPLDKRSSLEETIDSYLEESSKSQDTFKEWMKRFRERTDKNLKKHDFAIKGLEKKVEQLAQEVHASITNDSKSVNQVKTVATKSSPNTHCSTFLDSNIILCTYVVPNLIDLEKVPANTPLIDTVRQTPNYTKSLQEFISNKKELRNGNKWFGEYENLEEFLMSNEINEDLGDFLELDDLLSKNGVEPFGILSHFESKMGIGLEDFSGKQEHLLDKQAPQFGQNEQNSLVNVISRSRYNEVMRNELVYMGNNFIGVAKNIHVFVGCYIFLADFIVLVDVRDFIEKGLTEILLGRPFRDSMGSEESVIVGLVWLKIGDDKTIFKMPRVISKFHHLSTKQCKMMGPILRVTDEDKAKGFDHPYQKIKEFYKGCMQIGDEYKRDEKVIEWITHEHVSVYEMT